MDVGDAFDGDGNDPRITALALSGMIWFLVALGAIAAFVGGNWVIAAFLWVLAFVFVVLRRVSSFVEGLVDAVLSRLFRTDRDQPA